MFSLAAALRARKHKVDLVYGRSLFGCIFSSLLGLTTVFESHAPISHLRRGRLKFSWSMLKRFERIVVISEALKQYYMEEHGIPKQHIKVAHDGADEPQDSETVPFQNSGKLQVGYVGHLYPGKGMEIIEPLAKGCPWAYFHLIGGTESDIDYWQRQLGELDNVKFYGFMPPSRTEKYRRSFDVLIAPYLKQISVLSKGENIAPWMSPLKIFEYMSAAKPMLVSDLPVLREVLQHNVTALLCHPEDLASWTNALERLRDDSDLAARIGKAAYEEFKAKYTWKARAKQVLENVVSGSPS